MAKAIVPKVEYVTGNPDGTFNVDILVIFSGSDVGGGTDISSAIVLLDGSDNPIDIKNKIRDAVLNEASRIGYTLVGGDIILPDFQKGN